MSTNRQQGRQDRRTRIRLTVAALLLSVSFVSGISGLHVAGHVSGLVGSGLLLLTTVDVLRAHRPDVPRLGWLDALASTMTTSGLLIYGVGDRLRAISGAGELQVALQLILFAALCIVAATAAVVTAQVGRSDRRAVQVVVATSVLLVGTAAVHARALGILPVSRPWVAVIAGVCCVALLAMPLVPGSRTPVLGLSPRGETFSSFAAIAVGAVVLFLTANTANDWACILALGGLLGSGARLALLVSDLPALHIARTTLVTDEVTGLPNRRALLRDTEALARSFRGSRSSADCAVLTVIDVDGLHLVKDAWGREVCDELLRQVADRFRAVLPTEQRRLVRVDGGVFAVLLRAGGHSAGIHHAEGLVASLATPFTLPQLTVRLHAVVGMALLHSAPAGEKPMIAVDLLRRAEAAATSSRVLGGVPVLHDVLLDEAVAARTELVSALTAAIEDEQLVLHFQPQLTVETMELHGAEALVRWCDPHHGVVPPDVFVPLAEELGLQALLTRWVVGEALREVARWRESGVTVPVSVNLSPSDLQPELVDDVARALTEAGVPGSALVLEITETGIVSDPDGAAAVLTALGVLGVEISIDDYGTGYSSLSLLMALPVMELKIDRAFVRNLGRDDRSAVVMRTTVDLAHSLGLRVVAEGVETTEALALLEELGCDVSQGYLHSRPLPAEQVRSWFADVASKSAARDPHRSDPASAVPGSGVRAIRAGLEDSGSSRVVTSELDAGVRG